MTATKQTAQPGRKGFDWEAVEIAYRTGRFSLRQLTAKFGPSPSVISRKAAEKGWPKDLSLAIKQATQARVIAAVAKEDVDAAQRQERNRERNTTATVAAVASMNAEVILAHRGRVAQATDVAMRMLAELDATTTHAAELEALWLEISGAKDEDNPAIKAALMRRIHDLLALHSRIGSIHKMLDALSKAQTLERQAFGLDVAEKEPEKVPPLDWSSIPDEERQAAYLRMVSGG